MSFRKWNSIVDAIVPVPALPPRLATKSRRVSGSFQFLRFVLLDL